MMVFATSGRSCRKVIVCGAFSRSGASTREYWSYQPVMVGWFGLVVNYLTGMSNLYPGSHFGSAHHIKSEHA